MNRRNAGIIALILAGSAATGVAAVTKSASIGQAANGVSDAEVVKRKAELDAWQQEIQAQLEQKPPKIVKRQPDAGRASAHAGRALVTYASDPAQASDGSWSESTSQAPSSSSSSSPGRHVRRPAPTDDVEETEAPQHEEASPDAESTTETSPVVVVSAPGAQPTSSPVTHSSSSPTGAVGSESDDEPETEEEHESEGGDD